MKEYGALLADDPSGRPERASSPRGQGRARAPRRRRLRPTRWRGPRSKKRVTRSAGAVGLPKSARPARHPRRERSPRPASALPTTTPAISLTLRGQVGPARSPRGSSGAYVVPLADADRCCGSAGIYNVLHPDERPPSCGKIGRLKESGATVVAAANPGCSPADRGRCAPRVAVRVAHPLELLDEEGNR
jgi:hypothetical protein